MHNDLHEKSSLNPSDLNRNQHGYKTLRWIPEYQTWRNASGGFLAVSCIRTDDPCEHRRSAGFVLHLNTYKTQNYGQRVTGEDSRCGITTLTRIWGTATGHKRVSPPVICDKVETWIHEWYGPTAQNFFEMRVVYKMKKEEARSTCH
jgi:hypothetical protein